MCCCPASANWIVSDGLNKDLGLNVKHIGRWGGPYVNRTSLRRYCEWRSALMRLLVLQDCDVLLSSIRSLLLWKYHSEVNVLYSCWLLICIMQWATSPRDNPRALYTRGRSLQARRRVRQRDLGYLCSKILSFFFLCVFLNNSLK